MTTCIKTLAGICKVIDNVRNNNCKFSLKIVHFEGDKVLIFKSDDQTNLTLMVISLKMTIGVRYSISLG